MELKTEESRFKLAVEKKQTWKTVTETSGTDSPATRMYFFIGMPRPDPHEEVQPPAKAVSRPA